MVEVVGVRFRTAGKIYFFNPKEFQVKSGDHVIVETARGIEFGSVVSERRQVKEKCIGDELKPVLRIATKEDEERAEKNREKEKEAYQICLEKIKEHNLDMKLVSTEYTFDNNKVLFYFTADGRIDFRQLVKDLAAIFKTRIELRQIGVRDETKILGGIGICGRPLCCASYLSEFIPVSIKMAKEQNLSLNPTKISGVCGRLMCCLKNEQDTYEYLNSKLPNVGDEVKVFIYRDSQDRLIATVNKPLVELDETAVLTVKEVSKNGAFLDWGLEKDLFLPYKEQTVSIKSGDKVLVGVYLDKSNRLCATMKAYKFLKCTSTYEPDDVVTGTVYNYNPEYGVFVAVDNKYHGLVQKKELTTRLEIGQQIQARVKSVRPDGKLDLSLRKKAYLQMDEDAEKIYKYIENNGGQLGYTDKAKPEVIREDFQMSKSEFKRAIGRLLKEHRIIIGESNIFLNK